MSLILGIRPDSLYASLEKVIEKTPPTDTNHKKTPQLTGEEQLLAIFLAEPVLFNDYHKQFEEIVWQSVDAQTIAKVVATCYNDQALVKNQVQFLSRTKTLLDSRIGEKIDSWQFWLSQTWPNLSSDMSKELVSEKLSQMTTKRHEQTKEHLAQDIRAAQEKGDIKAIKELMNKLTNLSKEDSSS
jgi:hypothetical protein